MMAIVRSFTLMSAKTSVGSLEFNVEFYGYNFLLTSSLHNDNNVQFLLNK
jgi:hypothetical protein